MGAVGVIKIINQIVQSNSLCNQLACAIRTCFDNLNRRSPPGWEAWHTLAKSVKHIFVKCNFPAGGDRKIPGEWPFPTGDIVNAGFLKNFIENAGDSRRIREGWLVWDQLLISGQRSRSQLYSIVEGMLLPILMCYAENKNIHNHMII